MKSEIFISFFIAISLIQISVTEDLPSTPTPTNEAQSNTSPKPPAVLPVVRDNVWYYGTWVGGSLKSFIMGDEWSLKYVLHKFLEGTHWVGSTIVSASDFLLKSPYITNNSGSASPSDTTGDKGAETKKPEAGTPPSDTTGDKGAETKKPEAGTPPSS